jgi:methyltransferase
VHVSGPYRYVNHPNYLAVVGEIVSFALIVGALITGVVALVLFGWLLRKRIRVEERALKR